MRSLLNTLWLLKMTFVESRRWHSPQRDGKPHVFYGYEKLPARTEPASGGIIKCQDLEHRFPNAPASPNLLYLVSSALPPHLPVLLRAAKRARCPIVLNQNGVAYPAWHPVGWAEANHPLALAYHAADHVFWQSDFCRRGADRYLGAYKGPGEILFNAVDTSVFTPGRRDAAQGPVVLVSGSHMFRYRLETAIQAFAGFLRKIPRARMIVAGRYCWEADEAACRREIVEVASQAGVAHALDWRGAYSQADAPQLMREADLLLHTKYNDPCPRLVVEAMACGLPVVYSASGGVPELVGPDAGAGVPAPLDWDQDHPPNPAELAEAMETVWNNHSRMSNAARQRAVRTLDVASWVDRHAAVFSQLAQRHR